MCVVIFRDTHLIINSFVLFFQVFPIFPLKGFLKLVCFVASPVSIDSCTNVFLPTSLSQSQDLLFFLLIFDPPDPGTRKINDFHQQMIGNSPISSEIGSQKLRIGCGSVLTKYEPMASCLDLVLKVFRVHCKGPNKRKARAPARGLWIRAFSLYLHAFQPNPI